MQVLHHFQNRGLILRDNRSKQALGDSRRNPGVPERYSAYLAEFARSIRIVW